MFDKHLMMDTFINHTCRSAHYHLRNSSSVRELISSDGAATLVHSLFYPSQKIYELQRSGLSRCYYTLTNSQDQTFITAAIQDSIYRQRREKTFSQDQI